MNKIALVTGAGSGIGRAVAWELNSQGWTTVLTGRRGHTLEETAAACKNESLVFAADVSDSLQVKSLFQNVLEKFGRLDLLVNNAGVNAPSVPLEELAFKEWKRVIDINVTGVFLCTQEAFRMMKAQSPSGGRIINNGSISAHVPRPMSVAYTASKHAVTGLTKATSLDGRAFGITCGQIDIGNAATDMTKKMRSGIIQPDGSTKVEATMDMAEVGRAVAYMASLPPDTNMPFMTIMANEMPFMGRG